MAPKKPKGPFWFFMAEYRSKEQAKGRDFYSIEQLKCEAAPHWESLDSEARGVYIARAKAYKSDPKNVGERYTSQGVPFSVIAAEEQKSKRKQEAIKVSIAELIQTAVCGTELEKMQVCFISFNYFCKTYGNTYVPAELAMVRYSLEGGVMEKLHEFINPVKIPLGMAYDAVRYASGSHKLPPPPDSMGENDYEILLGKVISFMTHKREDNKYKQFLLFTSADEIPVVENIMEQFIEESKIDFNVLVCPLPEFFYQLKVATESYGLEIRNFPDRIVAAILLRKDQYEYTTGISCSFHETLGNTLHCALSRVIRWTYIISDNCCLDVGIELVAGLHLPANADTFLCSDTTIQSDDRLSFVSTSDMTHVSMPKIKKTRSESPSRASEGSGSAAIENAKGAVIYSSRAGIPRKVPSSDTPKIDAKVMKNPFYMVDSSGPSTATANSCEVGRFNPFSRERMFQETRAPLETVGHGRGMLLKKAFGSSVGSSVSLGSGRGTALFSSAGSSVGTASTIKTSDDEDD